MHGLWILPDLYPALSSGLFFCCTVSAVTAYGRGSIWQKPSTSPVGRKGHGTELQPSEHSTQSIASPLKHESANRTVMCTKNGVH